MIDMTMLLPLLMGKGNINMTDILTEMIKNKSSENNRQNKIDPMTIMMIGLLSQKFANTPKNEIIDNVQNNEKIEKNINLDAIENFSSTDITEALKIMLNNANQ